MYLDVLQKVKMEVKIPVAVKFGIYHSNIVGMADKLKSGGAKGIVMFNRFYEPDIDINKMEVIPASILSQDIERRYVLRWIGMASAQDIKIDISASTGVHSGQDAVKYLLAGATTVQVCSVLYNKGISYVKTLNEQISNWMSVKGFKNIEDFRGKLNYLNYEKPTVFERTQFMKYFSSF